MRRLLIFIVSILFLQNIYADQGIDITNKSLRIALVIGNSSYLTAPLKNPVDDAIDMASMLKQKGFSVTLLNDANQRDMKKAISQFGKDLTRGVPRQNRIRTENDHIQISIFRKKRKAFFNF
jgi:hypothetical protein